jgi:hypothetical protein
LTCIEKRRPQAPKNVVVVQEPVELLIGPVQMGERNQELQREMLFVERQIREILGKI